MKAARFSNPVFVALDTPDHLKQAGGSLEDVFMRLTHEEEGEEEAA